MEASQAYVDKRKEKKRRPGISRPGSPLNARCRKGGRFVREAIFLATAGTLFLTPLSALPANSSALQNVAAVAEAVDETARCLVHEQMNSCSI